MKRRVIFLNMVQKTQQLYSELFGTQKSMLDADECELTKQALRTEMTQFYENALNFASNQQQFCAILTQSVAWMNDLFARSVLLDS